ncbi:cytochrome b/b6 domain-containing protein [Ramlibacter sp. MMS24-I3-19]|uniref:cytochrome b/b6 domain-containing protein n=1 Tax=Ramlibacter sp. MMS24-I3-19 TaxID=3416606 RepID=UPI003D07841B
MNTLSASRADMDAPRRALVWDAPVRVFHWLLALSFAIAWLTAEGESWRLVHVTAGYTVAGLVAFRIVWGLVGSRHARFADFVRGPRAVASYVGSLLRGRPDHHAGHNPAGALAIVALLALAALTAASGWAAYTDVGGEWLEDVHEALANTMLAVVVLHVVAVLASSWLHRENLVGSMIHGRKAVPESEGIRRPRRGLAVLLLVAVLGFWALQWQSAPAGGWLPGASGSHRTDDDDD